MLKFIITSLQTKAPHGRLISGNLESGTLKTGQAVFLHTTNGQFVQQCTIQTIFNNGKTVTSFSSSQTARRLKITLEPSTVNLAVGQVILGTKSPKASSLKTTIKGFAQSHNFSGTILTKAEKTTFTIPTPSISNHIWRSSNYDEFGISLQGGGVKGAFGVGALKFLHDAGILDGKKKIHLASASTGSITSAMLAENSPESIDKALAQYGDLQQMEDMLTLKTDVKRILNAEPALKKSVLDLMKTGGDTSKIDFDAKEFATDKVKDAFKKTLNDIRSNPLSVEGFLPLAGANFLNNIFDGVKTSFKNVVALTKINLSLAELDPVRLKLTHNTHGVNANLLAKRIRSKNVTFNMAVTSLETGATCYVNEKLELLYPKKGVVGDGYNYEDFEACKISHIGGVSVGTDTPTKLRLGVTMAAITSGAFPALFEPQKIRFVRAGKEEEELFNDGGIRENMPISILGNTHQVKNIIAIYCSQIDESEKESRHVNNYSWVDVITRSMDFIDSENARNDISSGVPMNTSLHGDGEHNVLHIAPTTGTLGLAEIQPYNIQTTIWYGYMRAYDEVFLSDFKHTFTEPGFREIKTQLRENTEDLFFCFRAIGKYGAKLLGESAYRVPVKSGATSGNREYVMWNAAAKGLNRRSLSNFDKDISVIAFDYEALFGYLHLKNELLGLLLSRHKLTEKDPNNKAAFMYGEHGFMKKALISDWLGLYEHLDYVKIAANKRNRLQMKFRSYSPLDEQFSPNLVDKTIFGESGQKAPKRASKASHPEFYSLTTEIRTRVQQLQQKGVGMEGNMTDKLISDLVILLTNDNEMVTKDKSYFA